MSQPEIFHEPIPKETVKRLAEEEFVDMIKFVVDLDQKIICAGGGLHSDEERLLIQEGSQQSHLWGGNYYLNDTSEDRFEYVSMINVRPADGNKKQEIQSESLRREIRDIALHFFESNR
jgi:hypothetical protein